MTDQSRAIHNGLHLKLARVSICTFYNTATITTKMKKNLFFKSKKILCNVSRLPKLWWGRYMSRTGSCYKFPINLMLSTFLHCKNNMCSVKRPFYCCCAIRFFSFVWYHFKKMKKKRQEKTNPWKKSNVPWNKCMKIRPRLFVCFATKSMDSLCVSVHLLDYWYVAFRRKNKSAAYSFFFACVPLSLLLFLFVLFFSVNSRWVWLLCALFFEKKKYFAQFSDFSAHVHTIVWQ